METRNSIRFTRLEGLEDLIGWCIDKRSIRSDANRIRKQYGVGYLLGSSTKIDASNDAGEGYLSYIQYLSPANGYNEATDSKRPSLCPYATKGCTAACLGISAGRMRFTSVQLAQINRTRLFHQSRKSYFIVLVDEILRAKRRAERDGLKLSIRLNGTSDILWEYMGFEIQGVSFYDIFQAFPDVMFYDYTKIPFRYRKDAVDLPNYRLTYSYTGEDVSVERANEYISAGCGVSVVYTGDPMEKLQGLFPNCTYTVDGDAHDMRFLDPAGSLVLLKAKGDAKRDRSGFVVHGKTYTAKLSPWS